MKHQPTTTGFSIYYLLMLFAIIFAVVDNLFLGYFIWQTLGGSLFVIITLMNMPIAALYKYYSFREFWKDYKNIQLAQLTHFFRRSIYSQELWAKGFMLIIAVVATMTLFNIYYGALFIQILKLFVTQMGITSGAGYYITMSLVSCSIIPDAILYIRDSYKKIESVCYTGSAFRSIQEGDKASHILVLVGLVLIGSYIFTQIEFSQTINSYQHFMIEVLEVYVPYVSYKSFIFCCMFINVFAQLYGMTVGFLAWLDSFDQTSPLDYDFSAMQSINFIILVTVMCSRAIGQWLMTGELASNPFNINAQHVAIFKSMTGDVSCYNGYVGTKEQRDQPKIDMMMRLGLMLLTIGFLVLGMTQTIPITLPALVCGSMLGLLVSYCYPTFIIHILNTPITSSSMTCADSRKREVKEAPDLGTKIVMSYDR